MKPLKVTKHKTFITVDTTHTHTHKTGIERVCHFEEGAHEMGEQVDNKAMMKHKVVWRGRGRSSALLSFSLVSKKPQFFHNPFLC